MKDCISTPTATNKMEKAKGSTSGKLEFILPLSCFDVLFCLYSEFRHYNKLIMYLFCIGDLCIHKFTSRKAMVGALFSSQSPAQEVSHTSGPAAVDTYVMSLGQDGDELA